MQWLQNKLNKLTTPSNPKDAEFYYKFGFELNKFAVMNSLLPGVAGGCFGGVISLFAHTTVVNDQQYLEQWEKAKGPTEKLKAVAQSYKGMGKGVWRNMKYMGALTFLFVGFENIFEKLRGRCDIYNSMTAGCTSGAVVAIPGGPQSMCLSCVGFAAFSAVIDTVFPQGFHF
eukprot:gnl/Hemi2/9457_TR3283_c0_g1_i1.p2 gnl/Hemi2/9457_TR3283_c0_g1~~gnl/Hemi2/9457_TR3283_c0_g1_i1.p2  ORF type:complete len:172 (+),score=43.08 gnl/Hemi2/9457_TR3283_c0_g1_i1:64-579(+)